VAVLITKQDCDITDANAFNPVDVHNLGMFGLWGHGMVLPQIKNNITFATAGTSGGCLIGLTLVTAVNQKVICGLIEKMGTCTITVANPGVVTFNAHGLSDGDMVCLEGTIGVGDIRANQVLYVVNKTANTFELSITAGGTSGRCISASGTINLWRVRASSVKTTNEIAGNQTNTVGNFLVPFEWSTPYVVDTTAGKWGLVISTLDDYYVNQILLFHSNHPGTMNDLTYALWHTSTATFSSGNDCVIFRHHCDITTSVTLKGVASTNTEYSAGRQYCGIICANSGEPDQANNAFVYIPSTIAVGITLTLDGYLAMGSLSGFRVGTEANPIPLTKPVIITTATTLTASITQGFGRGADVSRGAENMNMWFYGEVPSVTIVRTDAAASGQKIVNTKTSSGWSIGDTVVYGPLDFAGVSVQNNTIAAISDKEITLTNNLTRDLLKDAYMYKLNGRAIQIVAPTAAYLFDLWHCGNANFVAKGVYFYRIRAMLGGTQMNAINYPLDDTNTSRFSIEDCVYDTPYTGGFYSNFSPNTKGLDVKNVYGMGNPMFGCMLRNTYVGGYPTGDTVIDKWIHFMSSGTQIWHAGTGTFALFRDITVKNCVFGNFGCGLYRMLAVDGVNHLYKDNFFYGLTFTSGAGRYACFNLRSCVSPVFNNNYYYKCSVIYKHGASSFVVGMESYDETFVDNTVDFDFEDASFISAFITDPKTTVSVNSAGLPATAAGTRVSIENEGGVAKKDMSHLQYGEAVRCGDGLTDTTVHTAGSGKFSMRFEPKSYPNSLVWEFYIPTGNIQNKEMSIGVWVKINNAAYYAGSNRKPRLTITYDKETTVTANAAETTEWQLLSVIFTPLTTYGQIKFKIEGYTAATGSNAYFYMDDISVLYPAGEKLDLGGLDLWADGLPITPPIATVLSANDVWAASTAVDYGANTMGELNKDTKTKVEENQTFLMAGL
jgi:hypothetical protein